MKVLVTGATGLIGIHAVVEMLNQGKAVRALVRSKDKLQICLKPFGRTVDDLEVVIGDVTDKNSIAAAMPGCDALLHCAGVYSYRRDDAQWLWQTNVEGTQIVLQCAVDAGLDPVIHVSSYLALFPAPGDKHRAEDPVTPQTSMYSKTKAAAEHIARELQENGSPVVTVYPGSVQGPHDPTYGVGTLLLEQAIRSKKLLLTGGGRPYTDVRDLAQLLDRAMQPGKGPRRYMYGGYYVKDEDLLHILRNATQRDIKAQKIPGWLLRFIGRAMDLLSKLTGTAYQLTAEAAQVLTNSVECDDQAAIDELNLTRVGVEKSFQDLVSWMVTEGKIPNGERQK